MHCTASRIQRMGLDGPRYVPGGNHGLRVVDRPAGPYQPQLLSRRSQVALVDHDRSVVRHRYARRESGSPGRATCQAGFATIWYQWKNMLITPFYWLMAPWYRRSQRTTVGEMIEDRYGRGLALFYSLFAMSYFAFVQGSMLKGAGKLIAVATGGQVISPNGVVTAMTVTFILYSFFGGLLASAYTDFIQGFLIIALSFMLIPTGLVEIGGFHAMRECLPKSFFDLYNQASGVNAFAIAMLAINGLLSMSAQPHALSMYATGRTERAGRVGHTYGSLVKRFCISVGP